MPKRMIKGFTSSPACKALKSDDMLSKQADRNPGWVFIALISLGLVLLSSCGGPSQQVLTAQALSQMQARDPNKELQQQQLMVQATRPAVTSYKDYKVGPEDLLGILIFGQDRLSRELRVNGQGEIAMPLVGVVKVAGMTPQQIETRLEDLYNAQFLVNPQVTVVVKEFRYQRVSVTGAVAKPGIYELIGPRTLLEVLSLAGGLSSQTSSIPAGDVINVTRHPSPPELAGTRKAGTSQISTQPTETVVIDLRRLVSGESPELNIMVANGDVVHVPFADTAYVMGSVRYPKSIAVKENLTVSQAVALAGGLDPLLSTNRITIMRFDKQGSPTTIEANLSSIINKKESDIPIKGSDVIMVNESAVKMALFLFKSLIPQPSLPVPF
jgi:polysaccharide export outer membrane protein